MPREYCRSILGLDEAPTALKTVDDSKCLATLKHYRSLVPMAKEARKPIFHLTVADGAIGNHGLAVQSASSDFRQLAQKILLTMNTYGTLV